ncbi:MAG: bacterial Ig-like domain-containing protein, partial [Synergistaceae bacterium]|nr:bacterial Ig-like domain-containing protein [Synergistaceae bacterium]
YRAGETYDYGGAVVTAIYKDGSTKDVTEDAVFNPAEGTTVVSSGSAELATQTVSVSYNGKTDSFDLATGGFAIVSLEVTAPPDKTVYYLQEDFDLTGFIVTAVYADGSRKDVTDKVELNRSAMTDFAIEDEYSDLTRNIPVSVEITYEELDETLVDNIISDEVIASIDETRGIDSADEYKDFSLGIQNVHEIQYLDTSSGKIRTLTYHTFVSQPDGVFDMIDDDYMYVTADRYQRLVEITREDNEYWQSHPEYEGNVTVLEMSTACGQFGSVTSGQQYGYDEVVIDCVLKYDMNTITGKYFTYPVTEGTVGYTSYSRGFVPVLQLCYGAEASTTMNLYCKMIRSMAITTPTKASYHYGEAFDTTGITAEVTFTDGEVRDVSADVTISPAQGTAITRTQSGTVRYRNPVGGDNTSDSFSITLIALQGLDITPPTKTSYRYGEIIDYTGARVIAVYSDNSREDVTSAVTFSPSAGTAITGDTTVSVSYTNQWRETAIESITLTLATLVSLSATNPTKTEYTTGETIDYSGMVVTAEFSDGTTEDVTDSCSITPRAGKAFNPSTDTFIHIEYAAGEAMRSTEINFGVATLESITITANPTKMHYISGETINYSGLAVTASYANGNSWSVTSSCNITPRAGKAFDPSTDTNVTISYTDNGITQTASLTLLAGELQGIEVTKYMDNQCTTTMDYTGMVVTATYSDGTADVTDSCTFSPSAGAAVSNTVTITYTEKEITKNCTFTLDKAYLGLIVETPPTKTTYTPGETVDYSGAMIKMVYSDGTEHDVTDFCSYMPVVDGETTTVTVSCAPAEKAFAEAVYGYIARSIAWEYSSVPYTSRPTSIYRVTAGHTYFIAVGFASNIDFDVSFTTTDVSQATSDVTGNVISYTTKSKGAGIVYTPTSDGYINVRTCRVSGRYPNYLYDANAENKTVTTTFTLTTQGA